MPGPSIQTPSAVTPIIQNQDGTVTVPYATFFSALQKVAFYSSRSGSTSSRPTSSSEGRYIGMPFFDQSLGKPVFLKIASSNTWVDATGAIV